MSNNSPGVSRPSAQPLDALDPHGSYVVEACAGSGKTWLLVSRMLRLLLDGAAPGRILAITFTRKAAREIENRLADWLRQLAVAPEQQALGFLCERGLNEAAARSALPRARCLLQQVVEARPAITITTFHGWFKRIVEGAPLTSGLAGYTLVESDRRLLDEAWQLFGRRCARDRESDEASSLQWLLAEIGLVSTRRLLQAFLARRAEWHALCEGRPLAEVLAALRVEQGAIEPEIVIAEFMRHVRDDALEFAGMLVRNTATDAALGQALITASDGADLQALFDAICTAVLTTEGQPRATRKPSAALTKRFGAAADRFLALHAALAEQAMSAQAAIEEWRAYELNHHALTAGIGLLGVVEDYKRERRLMDFSDLEWHADRLLQDDTEAAFIQARLDARYRHILLDEFQDTNPLQWRILRAWLGAYDATQDKPRVFMVGDPKQSIYRFRRAEPRIFDAATEFFAAQYGALHIPNDVTRRNAQPVVAVVNAVFADAPPFVFRSQTSLSALPGRVEVLPLIAGAAEQESAVEEVDALRDPLDQPLVELEDERRAQEAAMLAERIAQMVGHWEVVDTSGVRPARYDDVMILCRRRTRLAEYERALRHAGIPYATSSRGGLLQTLEAADLCALLRFLASPADDLSLAHALRAPVFGIADEDLIALARVSGDAGWWLRLGSWVESGSSSAALTRAHNLLSGWIELAARLPVHDLLDRIYFEGELAERYQRVVPSAMWPAVAANLEAFIALALQLDAGRYPSLPRFVDELARLSSADDDAPDEGSIEGEAAQTAAGRVRILTVHGAKGLEAPIVWLIDANATQGPNDAYRILMQWPPGDERPSHLSCAGAKGRLGYQRQALFDEEALAAAREDLNLLYVALTRARQYLFVSGVEDRRSTAVSAWQRVSNALEQLVPGQSTFGDEPRQCEPRVVSEVSAIKSDESAASDIGPVPVGSRRPATSAAQHFGTRLHALLELAADDPMRDLKVVGSEPAIAQQARKILCAPHLARFFDPAAYTRAFNEIDIVLRDGSIGRIDRLIESKEGWWILDYKSGTPEGAPLEAYRQQLEAYRKALGAAYPERTVHCALIFGDATLIEV